MSEIKEDILKFKFDVSAYRLLGRELITDRVTALFELVKNSYDANAENVMIKFINVYPRSDKSKIIIEDDGLGMSFEDVKNKWMIIGTGNKRKSRQSPAPYKRNVVGKKGVGRFAVDKLGAKLLLKTTQKGSTDLICLETDWSYYQKLEEKQLSFDFSGVNKYFTDVENKWWKEVTELDNSGTILEISMVNDFWTENDITRSYKELSKLISPSNKLSFPFNIVIDAPEYKDYNKKLVKSIIIDIATFKISLNFNPTTKEQEVLKVENNELKTIWVDEKPCGLIALEIFYLDQAAKNKFRKIFPTDKIDGIKVYRDGIITTPFAEYASNMSEKKDLFGIDKRRWSGFFDRISSRDIFGWVEISDERNPDIIDSTNRQNFVDNEAWKELKDLIIEQISKIEDYLKKKKVKEIDQTASEFKNAKSDLSKVRKQLNLVINEVESIDVKESIKEIEREVAKTQATVQKSLKDYQELEKEKKQQENLFFSLVSLQTYAGMLSHITRTSIGRIKRNAEFIHKYIPDPKFNEQYKLYSGGIYKEMNQLDSAIDFLLKYAKDDQYFEEINVKAKIEYIFHDIYATEFTKRRIKSIVEINKELIIEYNPKSFEDIFDNLIDNSFKALENQTNEKVIKCSAIIENDKFIILFSDNGHGVPEKDKYRIFDVFYTTTSEQGGAGLGLFIVKSRLEALKGSIEVIENELKPTGTTFRIELPFKK